MSYVEPEPESEERPQKRSPLMWVAIIFAAATAGTLGQTVARQAFGGERTVDRGSITRVISEASAEINRGTPIRVDEVTTLQRTEAHGHTLVYYYEVADSIAVLSESFGQEMEAAILARACDGASVRPLIEMGARVRYVYQNTSGFYSKTVDSCADEQPRR